MITINLDSYDGDFSELKVNDKVQLHITGSGYDTWNILTTIASFVFSITQVAPECYDSSGKVVG